QTVLHARGGRWRRVSVAAVVVLLVLFLGASGSRADPSPAMTGQKIEGGPQPNQAPVEGQPATAAPPQTTPSSSEDQVFTDWLFRCPSPARPHKLDVRCIGKPFDFIADTLSKDRAGLRSELAKFGITPIAGYAAQLMGNPTGGLSRGFTYAGALDMFVSWDLEKLLPLPGLSFNVGASWTSGQDLSAQDIGNVFTVQSVFSGTNTISLQQMFLQQQIWDGALTIAAGRLAPGNMFALLPVFNNYLSG